MSGRMCVHEVRFAYLKRKKNQPSTFTSLAPCLYQTSPAESNLLSMPTNDCVVWCSTKYRGATTNPDNAQSKKIFFFRFPLVSKQQLKYIYVCMSSYTFYRIFFSYYSAFGSAALTLPLPGVRSSVGFKHIAPKHTQCSQIDFGKTLQSAPNGFEMGRHIFEPDDAARRGGRSGGRGYGWVILQWQK